MKKEYIKPAMENVLLNAQHLLTTSYAKASSTGLDEGESLTGNGENGSITSTDSWENAW